MKIDKNPARWLLKLETSYFRGNQQGPFLFVLTHKVSGRPANELPDGIRDAFRVLRAMNAAIKSVESLYRSSPLPIPLVDLQLSWVPAFKRVFESGMKNEPFNIAVSGIDDRSRANLENAAVMLDHLDVEDSSFGELVKDLKELHLQIEENKKLSEKERVLLLKTTASLISSIEQYYIFGEFGFKEAFADAILDYINAVQDFSDTANSYVDKIKEKFNAVAKFIIFSSDTVEAVGKLIGVVQKMLPPP